jgi:Flp pilus assembly pilin Flp
MRKNDAGATAVEYGLLLAAIAALSLLLIFAVGRFAKAGFDEQCRQVNLHNSPAIQSGQCS